MLYKQPFTVICLVFLSIPYVSISQTKALSCTNIKKGTFYFYPKNTADAYIEERDEKYLKETNIVTGDTSLWEIKWQSDCVYSLNFISGSGKIDAATRDFLDNHKMVYQIFSISDSCYTFKGYADKTSNLPLQDDTMWLNVKTNTAGNELFKQMYGTAFLKKEHFRDTSHYAVLYVYRPGKLTNSLGDYLVYFDNNVMCVAKNNTGYIFKILKEGTFEIKSRLYKDESAVKLDVQFGHTYYVKSMIHWTITKRLYNFKLDMAIMKPEEGQEEYYEVNPE